MRRADRVAREPRAEGSIRQTFGSLLVHTPLRDFRWRLPFTFSTFDYRALCALLRAQGDAEFETAKVDGRTGSTVHTDRGDLSAPLIVDALGWRRVLSHAEPGIQPPEARLSRGLEVHPSGNGDDLELWLDPAYVRAGYSWSFPAGDELRVGVGSFEPRDHVKEPTVRLAGDLGAGRALPGQLDPAPDAPPDRGRRVLRRRLGRPLPADDGRGDPHGALLRPGLRARAARASSRAARTARSALARYAAFCDRHLRPFRWLLRVQSLVSRVNPTPAMTPALRRMNRQRFIDWSFGHYLRIAPPGFALEGELPPVGAEPVARGCIGTDPGPTLERRRTTLRPTRPRSAVRPRRRPHRTPERNATNKPRTGRRLSLPEVLDHLRVLLVVRAEHEDLEALVAASKARAVTPAQLRSSRAAGSRRCRGRA